MRRGPNIKTALDQRLVFLGIPEECAAQKSGVKYGHPCTIHQSSRILPMLTPLHMPYVMTDCKRGTGYTPGYPV